MGGIATNENFECEVGGVVHMCYFSPSSTQDVLNKKGKEKNNLSYGRIFPYIAHYLTTGDVIYPAHEGESIVSSLLEELGRLNLVRNLLQQNPSSKQISKPIKGDSFDSTAKLRVRTRNERWDGFGKVVSRLLKFSPRTNGGHVYRPPVQNKGQTIVLVRSSLQGKTQLKVHGPSPLLKSLLPDTQQLITPLATHSNTHLVPPPSSAHSVVVALEEHGFVVTVRSSWAEGQAGTLITQWLLHRRASLKGFSSISGAPSKKSSSLSRLAASNKHKSETRKKILKTTESKSKKLAPNKQDKSKPMNSTTNKDLDCKLETIDRKWSVPRRDFSSTSILSKSLSTIPLKECNINTLPGKKSKNATAEDIKLNFLININDQPTNNDNKKSKTSSIWGKYSKVSLKKVMSGIF